MQNLLSGNLGKVVNRIRRGGRTVLWTQQGGLGFANHLYLWLQAHNSQANGRDYLVLQAPGMEQWLDRFPKLRELTIARDDTRFRDRREWGVNPRLYQRYGVDYSREQLDDFIHTRLLSAPTLRNLRGDPETLIVNVRRGDYYAVPEFREAYGFDVAGYLEVALPCAIKDRSIKQVLVVSDDPAWCQGTMHSIFNVYGTVSYMEKNPLLNLQTLAGAHTLICTNSTFSYWGGYLATARLGSQARVVAPWFHKRTIKNGEADQLDPTWSVIDNIPGGWREK